MIENETLRALKLFNSVN